MEDSLTIVRVDAVSSLDLLVIEQHGEFVIGYLDPEDKELIFPKVVVIHLVNVATGLLSPYPHLLHRHIHPEIGATTLNAVHSVVIQVLGVFPSVEKAHHTVTDVPAGSVDAERAAEIAAFGDLEVKETRMDREIEHRSGPGGEESAPVPHQPRGRRGVRFPGVGR